MLASLVAMGVVALLTLQVDVASEGEVTHCAGERGGANAGAKLAKRVTGVWHDRRARHRGRCGGGTVMRMDLRFAFFELCAILAAFLEVANILLPLAALL